ncbi:MAG: MFS transporter, partial [Phycisphaerae bacterium]
MTDEKTTAEKKSPLREIVQPFLDLVHAPRALWGINLAYLVEGTVYFGMLNYLHMYFNEYVQLDDVWANRMVGVLTAGITFAMFILGFVADKWGVRFAIISAFTLLLGGRTLLSIGPTIGLPADGMGSALHLTAMGGIFFILVGYGMYQPGAYAAVRQFTTEKTASMGFAMLYAIMNLGIVLTAPFGFIRNSIGISGSYWVFVGLTVLALLLTLVILTPRTVEDGIARAKAERAREKDTKEKPADAAPASVSDTRSSGNTEEVKRVPAHLWISILLVVGCVYLLPSPWDYRIWGALAVMVVVFFLLPARWRKATLLWLANHPLGNGKFFFFIFCLIPVQTLFAHNW